MIKSSTDIQTTAYLVKEQKRTLFVVNEEKRHANAPIGATPLLLSAGSHIPAMKASAPTANPYVKQIGDTEDVVVGPNCRAGTAGYDFRGLELELADKMKAVIDVAQWDDAQLKQLLF